MSTQETALQNTQEAATTAKPPHSRGRSGIVRAIGLGLITGAADDDPSAIGTYASAGAKLGPSFLWTAPVTFPMMVAVVYLSSKLGMVAGEGLFAIIHKNYSRWFLFAVLVGVVIGNVIEAGADIGGMAAALNVVIPIPIGAIVVITGLAIRRCKSGGLTLSSEIFFGYSLWPSSRTPDRPYSPIRNSVPFCGDL